MMLQTIEFSRPTASSFWEQVSPQSISVAGNLVFSPVANANDTNDASFTFRVQDDDGTANGSIDAGVDLNRLAADLEYRAAAAAIDRVCLVNRLTRWTPAAWWASGETCHRLPITKNPSLSSYFYPYIGLDRAIGIDFKLDTQRKRGRGTGGDGGVGAG